MCVIGRGMIATALRQQAACPDGWLAYATGVADSGCTDRDAYRRDAVWLQECIAECEQTNRALVYFSSAPAVLADSPYGRHKRRMESTIVGANVRYCIIRLANVVGPTRNETQLVPALVRQCGAGAMTVQLGATRDLIHVSRLAAIVGAVLAAGVERETIIVVSGVSVPVLSIARRIAAIMGCDPVIDMSPGGAPQEFDSRPIRSIAPQTAIFDYEAQSHWQAALACTAPQWHSCQLAASTAE